MADVPDQIGAYQVIREIGRGGIPRGRLTLCPNH